MRPTRTSALLAILCAFMLAAGPAGAMPQKTVSGYVYHDANCDGTRQEGEPGLAVKVYLFVAGADGQVHTGDDQVVDSAGGGTNGLFGFSDGGIGHTYRISMLKEHRPAGYTPAPLGADNALTRPRADLPDYWSTEGFQLSETATVVRHLGLCRIVYDQPPVYLPLIVR